MLYRRSLPGLLLLFSFFPLHSPLRADDAVLPFAEPDEPPSVLSATRLQQSLLEVPAAVTVIDRQMIEQSGVREIPEILRLVPGMVVGYDTGSDVFVSMHGTSVDLARRLQVLIDGRSIYQPLLARVDWTGLPLELADIERIEVIRGPNSATWGANSFLGVVNIITRHPADVERARISYTRSCEDDVVEGLARAGSIVSGRSITANGFCDDGIEDFQARLAARTAGVDWRLTVAGRQDDGFESNLRRNGANYTDSKDVDSVYGRAVWATRPDTSVEFSFGLANMMAEQQYRPEIFVETPVAERDNDFASLAWDQELNDSNHLRLQASHSRFRREEHWLVRVPRLTFHPVLGELYRQNRECANGMIFAGSTAACTAADMPLLIAFATAVGSDPALGDEADFRADMGGREQRTEVELHDIWQITSDLRTVFGLTYDEARAESLVYLNGAAENTVWRAFAHGEWRLAPQWLLNVGGNQEYDDGAGNYFSPRYALNWLFHDGHALRLVYSEAVRTPDILETRADFGYRAHAAAPADARYSGTFFQTGRADGSAPTERIASSEFGYYGRFDAIRLSVDGRVFRDRLDLTEHNLDPTESEGFQIRPLHRMWLSGGELGLDWRPWPSQRLQLNYAYLDMDDAPVDDDNTNFVPQHSGSAAWWQDYGNGWQFGTTYAFYNDLRVGQFFFDRLENRLAKNIRLPHSQQVVLAAVLQTRLTEEPELRAENGGDRYRGWFSVDWRY
jgi:iron complex outermembrane receptor protein